MPVASSNWYDYHIELAQKKNEEKKWDKKQWLLISQSWGRGA